LINNTEKIDKIKILIEKQKHDKFKLRNIEFHNLTGHTSLTLIIIGIIVLGIIYVIRKCKTSGCVTYLGHKPLERVTTVELPHGSQSWRAEITDQCVSLYAQNR